MSLAPPAPDLPDLRIVPMAELVPHEDADERRVTNLARRLMSDGLVKNPPIVAPMADERFVVLDGANRTAALAELGVPDIIVQVADYAQVALSTWYHLVVGIAADQLLAAFRAVPGLVVSNSDREHARRALSGAGCIAYFAAADGTIWELSGANGRQAQAALLRRVVATYKGVGHIHRVQTDDLPQLQALYSEIGGLLVFPAYTPADILALARADVKLPSGITRHVIPHRALRLNMPLDVLWADTNLSEKNRWLAEWVRGRLQAGHVRFYEEPTVLFDE